MTHRPIINEFSNRFGSHKYHGECLEGMGLPCTGVFTEDKYCIPQVGDIVHCTRTEGAVVSYIKKVISVGEDIVVGTQYKESDRDFSFVAAELLGVVIEVRNCDNHLVWSREMEQ